MCDKSIKKITVIIPFANEGIEVENTLKSIFEYSNGNIDVIVINDASDDDFNYENVASKYEITYIKNEQRLGVASSRDLGIKQCQTEYFLLLDAHMRFYNNNWINRIVEELDKDARTLLCCQTKVLRKIENEIIEENCTKGQFSAAYIDYYSFFYFLEPGWIEIDKTKLANQEKSTVLVPCVLGAGYACSKKYWQYLRGLEGLLSYGNDEVLISLKVWLEGGVCKLLRDVEIGHIYRKVSPYPHISETRIYNRLFISHLLLPNILRKKAFAIEKNKNLDFYLKASFIFYEKFEYIESLRLDLVPKFTKDFYYHENFNRSVKNDWKNSSKKNERILPNLVLYIIRHINSVEGTGLISGKMGILILLYHYAEYSKNIFISQFADALLDEIIEDLSEQLPLNISNGLLGIGWGIEYLVQSKFIQGNTNDLLFNFDVKVMEISPSRMCNYNLYIGFGGIVRYLLSRLYSIEKNNTKNNPFESDFLREVYDKSKEIIENKEINDCPETYIEYILYYENKTRIAPTSIYDIVILPSWNKYSRKNKDLSLCGLVGLCLEFIIGKFSK